MVDLILNQEQKEYQKLARDFAQRELAGRAHQCDSSGEFPADILRKAWETGLLNVQLPEQFGGLDLKCWDAAVIAEELACGCAGIAAAAQANALALLPLLHSGSASRQKEWLEPFAQECCFAALPLDLYAPHRRQHLTVKKGGDGFELSGMLPLVITAEQCKWLLVEAFSGSAASTLFVVPRSAGGITVEAKVALLGLKAADVRPVKFERVQVTPAQIVGTENGAFAVLDFVRPSAYVLHSAAAVGLARSAMEHSIRYSKERRTFGQPISQHQAVAFMLADMAKDIEAARLLTWQAAAMIDGGGAELRSASIARQFSQNMAMR
ncbi:MAG: acyl-CoA dehydrogenase family protein, partial [Terriglobales bacterium]